MLHQDCSCHEYFSRADNVYQRSQPHFVQSILDLYLLQILADQVVYKVFSTNYFLYNINWQSVPKYYGVMWLARKEHLSQSHHLFWYSKSSIKKKHMYLLLVLHMQHNLLEDQKHHSSTATMHPFDTQDWIPPSRILCLPSHISEEPVQ